MMTDMAHRAISSLNAEWHDGTKSYIKSASWLTGWHTYLYQVWMLNDMMAQRPISSLQADWHDGTQTYIKYECWLTWWHTELYKLQLMTNMMAHIELYKQCIKCYCDTMVKSDVQTLCANMWQCDTELSRTLYFFFISSRNFLSFSRAFSFKCNSWPVLTWAAASCRTSSCSTTICVMNAEIVSAWKEIVDFTTSLTRQLVKNYKRKQYRLFAVSLYITLTLKDSSLREI